MDKQRILRRKGQKDGIDSYRFVLLLLLTVGVLLLIYSWRLQGQEAVAAILAIVGPLFGKARR